MFRTPSTPNANNINIAIETIPPTAPAANISVFVFLFIHPSPL
jgi:hypothetical protein